MNPYLKVILLFMPVNIAGMVTIYLLLSGACK